MNTETELTEYMREKQSMLALAGLVAIYRKALATIRDFSIDKDSRQIAKEALNS